MSGHPRPGEPLSSNNPLLGSTAPKRISTRALIGLSAILAVLAGTLFALAGISSENLTGDVETLAMLARQKHLNFEPGAEFLYSNSGYFLLSVVVKRASGKSLPEFARERIFEPLGMKDTHIHDDHTLVVARRATGYEPREQGGFAIDMSDFEQTGDGAVMTTVEDLARWDESARDALVLPVITLPPNRRG